MKEDQTAPEAAQASSAAADWAALEAAANEGAGAVAAPVEPAGPDLAQELTGLILAFVAVATPIFPSLGAIYTPETAGAAAGAVASVCVKHGWLEGGVMGEYAEEVTAAIVLLPLAVATNNGIRADLDARRAKEAEKAPKAGTVIAAPEPGPDGTAPNPSLQGWQPAPVAVKNNPGWGKA